MLFRQDFADGAVEQMELSTIPCYQQVMIKTMVHWCFAGLPLVIITPLLALLLHLPASQLPMLLVSLLLGTPTLSLIGSFGAALTVGLKRGGLLLALIVLPLFVPILIFGVSAPISAGLGILPMAQIFWLSAFFFLSATLVPLAATFALRINIYDD
jgi:heme exporter protein B